MRKRYHCNDCGDELGEVACSNKYGGSYCSATCANNAEEKLEEFMKQPGKIAVVSDIPTVEGVGKDAPTVVNDKGGKQSKVLYRYDLLDPKAMFEMTKVLAEGAIKYGEDNWRDIDVRDHLNHMIIHAYAYLAGDKSDDHLSHIMCRAMFAQAVEIQENP